MGSVRAIKVLIFHGYLLRGTGSNVYNASIARALARLGHEVHLLCQDREAAALPWISAVGGWDSGTLTIRPTPGVRAGTGEGSITAYLPEIGGLLPVYVRDRYEGFEVKEFPELSEFELEQYLKANVTAVRDVVERAGGVEAALGNHAVMGPAILARAGLGSAQGGPGFAAKVHGSALEFTVKPNPRFLPYAREGISAASGVLVGSRHTAESLWAALGDRRLPARTRLGPPGVDIGLFSPLERDAGPAALEELSAALRAAASDPAAAFARDPAEAADAVDHLAQAPGWRATFVGKLIDTKGVDLLLAAWPLVVAAHPGARLLIVGFGDRRERYERLCGALEAGDVAGAQRLAVGQGDEWPLRMLAAFLQGTPPQYSRLARESAGSVAFAGRLEHDEVGRLVPACDTLVMPSTFPEAFGMVAAEAAAAGVLPVSAAHSGMAEVSQALAGTVPEPVRELLSFPLGDGAVEAIAARLAGWFSLDAGLRREARRALTATATRLWSWEGVAQGVIAAAAGRLDELPYIGA